MEQSEWTLAWSDGMGFGIPELDAADRRLNELLHELNQAIAGGRLLDRQKRISRSLRSRMQSPSPSC
jgi:hypothetical protein